MVHYFSLHWMLFPSTIVVFLVHSSTAAPKISFDKTLSSLKKSDKITPFNRHGTRSRREADSVSAYEDYDSNENSTDIYYDGYDTKYMYLGPVCELVDARNSPRTLKDLENCTIVSGFVNILFMNELDEPPITSFSFPKLRVITEHLLIYRVYGLKSLKHLFPNLMMIGGQDLFNGYSMIIYENPQLTEIGLKSLKYIKRGAVRIQNNGKLCFINTVNWGLLGKVFGNNKMKTPVLIDNKINGCIDQCGNKSDSCMLSVENELQMPFCWGVNLCQKIPDACEPENHCECHPECLGGCSAPNNASACFSCKNLYHNLTCVSKCPQNTFLVYTWRCVESDYCSSLGYVLHEGECLKLCPQYHKKKTDDRNTYPVHTCERCNGTCAKVCTFERPHIVTNVHSLHKIHGCTIIETQLVISVTTADIGDKLERSLGELQQVDSLVVRRSRYLTSLSFLKSLRVVTGRTETLFNLENNDGYSIYILDNVRLRDLWNFEAEDGKPSLTIDNGKAFFHFNPYLCLNKIEKIANITVAVEDSNDISQTTNGDRITCVMNRIEEVTIKDGIDDNDRAFALLSWETPRIDDYRKLIGFHVHFKKSEFENATRFDEDSSGRSSWSIHDIDRNPEQDEGSDSQALIHDLTPYTKYAVFITTYTTAAARHGARSEIYYFTTKPSKPSSPRSVSFVSINESAINVSWSPPQHPNGNITHYIVSWKRQNDDRSVVDSVNTCVSSPRNVKSDDDSNSQSKPEEPKQPDASTPVVDKDRCSCDKTTPRKTESDFIESQTFADFLIDNTISYDLDDDQMYHDEEVEDDFEDEAKKRRKRSLYRSLRYKRSLNGNSSLGNISDNTSHVSTTGQPTLTAHPRTRQRKEKTWKREVYGTTTVVIGLHHFTEYFFQVSACNHAHETVECGTASIGSRRTKKLKDTDNIPSKVRYRRVGQDKYYLYWDPPTRPNGFIKLYMIYFVKKAGQETTKCCSAMDFNRNHSCLVSDPSSGSYLAPGTYSVSVQPVSLATNGPRSDPITIVIEQKAVGVNKTLTLVFVLIFVVLAIAAVVGGFVLRQRFKALKKPPLYASVNPEYSSIGVYVPDEYEISPDDIQLMKEIGQGHFGKVYEGLAQRVIYGESETRVAVKTLHENNTISKRMEFLKEASVMKAFNSHHVVRLLGVVSTVNIPMVIMEFMEHGDLKTYLRSTRSDAENRSGDPPSLQQKLQMCGEIADGMAYLAANKFVHRDLAARNCLVHQDMTVKIGDFGLTRDVYETDYYRIERRGILPVRWMAPESLKDGVFDSRSDVWSYGVVLWEIATLAEQPYQGQQHDQVTRFVIDGGYMEQPKECPSKLYDLMLVCWHYSPSMRPTFMEIVSSLTPDLNDKFKQVSYFNEPKEDEEVAEEDPFLGGDSLQSAECVTFDGNGVVHPEKGTSNGKNNYLHLNGGGYLEDPGERSETPSERAGSNKSLPHSVNTADTVC